MTDNPAFSRCKITVGPSGAEVSGYSGSAIQIAVDALAFRGGGTVELLEGTYLLEDAVRLRPDIALVGRGDVTLRRRDAHLAVSPLARDADVGQMEISPADISRFRPGMGVCLWDESGWAYANAPLRVAGIADGTLYVDEMMTVDRLAERGGIAVNHFPLILAREAPRCLVENLTLDGRVEDHPCLNSLWSSGMYCFRSPHCTVRRVRVFGVHGDGLVFGKASTDCVVEECETFENTHYGMHPGSHSARFIVRRSHIHHNGSDGLYFCWGVDHGLAEDNDIHHNGWRLWRSGISIGHQDTDNLIARNRIYENCKYGICFRRKTEANGAHRNVMRQNIIENNGQDPAGIPEQFRSLPARELVSVGVSVMGVTNDLVFEQNTIRETRAPGQRFQRSAFYIGKDVHRLVMRDNIMSGHEEGNIVDESGSSDHLLQK